MTDGVDDFFHGLAEREHEPLLRSVRGNVRFDIASNGVVDHWGIGIDRGALTVTHGDGDADCAIAGSRSLLAEICGGRANAMAAVLRGELTCSGDLDLIFAVQRLFPGPDDAVGPRADGVRRG